MQRYLGHLHSRYLWALVALIIIDGLFFGMTNPANVSSAVLFVGFSLAALTIFAVIRVFRLFLTGRNDLEDKHSLAEGFVTGVLTVSLALSSLGQLSMRDFMLLVIAAATIYWYVSYQKRLPS